MRARIAQQLDAGPTLLVLDNCEHVLEASASLVAFLLATTRDLQVLTTSRAPLRIAAERAVPLSLLETDDAVALFCSRARAVRPGRRARPGHGRGRRRAPRRPAVGDRDRRRPGADAVGRGGTPPARRPVRAAPQPGPGPARPAPHVDRGHRVVVGPAQRRRAARAGVAVGLPRRLRRRGRRRGAGAGRRRPGGDVGRALAGRGDRGRRRRADADAGDHPGVRGAATGGRGGPGRGLARAGAVGRGPRGPVSPGALHGGPGRGDRHAEPRGEQPHRRAAPRPRRGRRVARGPAGLGPRAAVDDHRRSRPDLRGGRQRRARAQRLGPARRRARGGPGGRRAAGDPPELAAGPADGPAQRGVGTLG